MEIIYRNITPERIKDINKKLSFLEVSSKVCIPKKIIFFQSKYEGIEERKKIREHLLHYSAPIIILSDSPELAKTAWKINAAYYVDIAATDWLNELKNGFERFLYNNSGLYAQKIEIPSIKTHDYLNPNEITFIKAAGNYSDIHMVNGSKIVATKKLKEMELFFKSFDFIERFGKSIILNLNTISKIQEKRIFFINGQCLEFPKYNSQFPYLIKRLLWETAKINYEENQ